jgi:hypothetical protein
MKLKIDVDCTPEEARAFFGLPDVKPMQEAILAEVQERMMKTIAAMDPETMMKTWLPATMQGWEQLREAFLGGSAPKKR